MLFRGLTSRPLVVVLVAALLAAACSSANDDASAPRTSTTAAAAPSSTATTAAPPTSSADAVEPTPPASEQLPEPASAEAIATVAGVLAFRNPEGDLVVANPDGSGARTISSGNERRLTQPTWSNDGARIAWSAFDADGAAIEIGTIDGEVEIISPLPTPPFYLSWSTSDSWIGALRPTSGSIEFLFASTADGSVRPVGMGQPFYFDWRNDGSIIAAVNGATLAEIPAVADEPPSQLSIGDPLGVFQAPGVVSSNPREVVAALSRSGFNEVVTLGSDGIDTPMGRADGPVSIAVNSTRDRLAVNVFTGEPQSQVISFQTDAPPDLPGGRVSIIDRDSGDVSTLPENRIAATQWSPDGTKLALLQAGDSREPGTPATFQWLVVDGDSVWALTPFTPSQEVAAAYLPFADQYNHSTSWWSPDGRALVMSGTIGGESGIWVDLIDDDSGARRVADGDIAVWSPR